MFKKKKDQTYQSYWSISWNIFKKNKVAMVCLFIVILLCLIALFAPLIAPYDPNKQVLTDRLMKPCGQHWFGTLTCSLPLLTFRLIFYGSYCLISKEWKIQFLASFKLLHSFPVIICTARLPIAVASVGPASTVLPVFSAVSRFR